VLASALDQVSGYIQQGLQKVLASALDSGEWPYAAEVTRNVSISTR